MEPFNPWTWRDPAVLVGGYDRPAGADEPAAGSGDPPGDLHRPERERGQLDLTGYRVEASDGGVGTVDAASDEVGARYLVVDTGPWVFGRKVLLPAGTVARVDHAARTVHLDRTRDEVKGSPGYDPDTFGSAGYRQRVADYYAGR